MHRWDYLVDFHANSSRASGVAPLSIKGKRHPGRLICRAQRAANGFEGLALGSPGEMIPVLLGEYSPFFGNAISTMTWCCAGCKIRKKDETHCTLLKLQTITHNASCKYLIMS